MRDLNSPENPYTIEVIYRVRLHATIETDWHNVEDLFERAFKLTHKKKYDGIELVTTDGGPCWVPYLTLETTNPKQLREFMVQLFRQARFAGVKFED